MVLSLSIHLVFAVIALLLMNVFGNNVDVIDIYALISFSGSAGKGKLGALPFYIL